MNRIALGLDIATNSTGYAIIDDEDRLLKYGVIDTSKQKDYFEKSEVFALQIKVLTEEFSFDCIGIEDILSKFASGQSSIKTIIALARFNALASYICYLRCDFKPSHINVLRARSLALGHSVPRGVNSKDYVLKSVVDWYPDIELPRMKRKNALAKTANDICDAVIVGKAVLRL